jgi:hypothetical protein
MACVLRRRPDGVFEGPIGATVTIDVVLNGPARLVHLFYAGQHDGVAPFQFTIRPGKNKLLVVAIGTAVAGFAQKMVIVETNVPPCPLRLFFWTVTNFSTVLDIEGV